MKGECSIPKDFGFIEARVGEPAQAGREGLGQLKPSVLPLSPGYTCYFLPTQLRAPKQSQERHEGQEKKSDPFQKSLSPPFPWALLFPTHRGPVPVCMSRDRGLRFQRMGRETVQAWEGEHHPLILGCTPLRGNPVAPA